MLLSFSHKRMLPAIEAGIAYRHSGGAHAVRCDTPPDMKLQTIRAWTGDKSRYRPLVEATAEEKGAAGDHTLHLWWKSRTAERRKLGEVRLKSATRLLIRRTDVPGDWLTISFLEANGERMWGTYVLRAHLVATDHQPIVVRDLALADGFATVADFADYFVPRPGDSFLGVLIKW